VQNSLTQVIIWLLYFATDIYGHVALKLGSKADTRLVSIIFSPLGLTAFAAWGASSLLWIAILSNNKLLSASSIGAVTYALMVLAAALVFKEAISTQQWIGIVFIAIGVYLVTR
jgi:drug/metabolite transporter (DMT)-like permease